MSFDGKINLIRIIFKILLLGPRVSVKRDFGVKSFKKLRKLLKGKKFEKLNLEISTINNHADYSQMIYALSDWFDRPEFITRWIEHSPNSSTAHLVSGVQAIHWAWEARTSNTADKINKEQWALFRERLDFAEDELAQSYSLDSKYADPLSFMITLGMGRGDDLDTIFDCFIKACQINPKHYHAHQNMLHALTEEWGGSYKQMFDFARVTCKKIKEPSALYTLIPQAHLQYWNYLVRFEGEPEKANNYMRSRVVKDEINDAYNKANEIMKTLPDSLESFQRGIFAATFYLSGQFERAKIEFDKLGKNISPYPWDSMMKYPRLWEVLEPGYAFSRIKKEVSRKASN